MTTTIVVLEGDQTGQELLEESLRVLDPAVTGVDVAFERFDLSLEKRRATKNQIVYEAADRMAEVGRGLKAATITPEIKGDVGSPNAILRERINGTVIVRTGRRIPGVRPVGGVHAPIAVIRMAVGDAYGAQEWREGEGLDEVACRTEKVTRRNCRAVAEYSFIYAQRIGGKVFGGPKYTVSPVYEGMLKEEMDAAAARYPGVRYEPQLIDATYALLMANTGEALVIPALNRDGDCLSDLVLQMFGSIAGSESLLISFDDDWNQILAGASLLSTIDDKGALASRAISESVFEAVYDGIRTSDLQGHATTTEFTDEVIKRVKTKLAVWPSL
jgi:isocitrate dehydrogenase (NAD+)